MSIKHSVHQLLRSFGYDIVRYLPAIRRASEIRRHILVEMNTQLVLDVGASVGIYARNVRELGYAGRIISFEPHSGAFETLRTNSAEDRDWTCIHCAIGNYDGSVSLNISNRQTSSSILSMADTHTAAAPDSFYIGEEIVDLYRLDTVFASHPILMEKEVVFMKLDVQGFEEKVLSGASALLESLNAIEIELSLVELYQGGAMFRSLINLLDDFGFRLVSWEDVLWDPRTHYILQADTIFVRK